VVKKESLKHMFAPVATSAADLASPTQYMCPIAVLYSLTSHHATAEIFKFNEIQSVFVDIKMQFLHIHFSGDPA
jgi:hypothetical protein